MGFIAFFPPASPLHNVLFVQYLFLANEWGGTKSEFSFSLYNWTNIYPFSLSCKENISICFSKSVILSQISHVAYTGFWHTQFLCTGAHRALESFFSSHCSTAQRQLSFRIWGITCICAWMDSSFSCSSFFSSLPCLSARSAAPCRDPALFVFVHEKDFMGCWLLAQTKYFYVAMCILPKKVYSVDWDVCHCPR